MLITFKSKSSPAVMMYKEHAERILELLNKSPTRGVITAAEAAGALAALEHEIELSKLHPDQDIEHHQDTTHSADALEGDAALVEKQHVGFATRVFPLLEMLRAAVSDGHDIVWGV
ncbi:hypothetical protein ASC94_16145 [Massilia sp. Root418]|uniref:DUF1840 domain-containing protein n=1 Tax=Massilia sp. Root418 TaxID=1736532 RepID=UPI0006FA1537|nr:DUF1840 domain-containing protein [Massilia sp. Root418]KQW91761.1 hypothetical protein ASC94_16145 [Massilia sp. Root418]